MTGARDGLGSTTHYRFLITATHTWFGAWWRIFHCQVGHDAERSCHKHQTVAEQARHVASAVLTWYLQPCVVETQHKIDRIRTGRTLKPKWEESASRGSRRIQRTRDAVIQTERGNKRTTYFPGDATSTSLYISTLKLTQFLNEKKSWQLVRNYSIEMICLSAKRHINLLKPTGHVMHQQFNIQQLYALPTLYLCVLYLSENKQRLVPLTP